MVAWVEARNPTPDSLSAAEQKYQAAPIFYAGDAPLAIAVIQPSECCLAEAIVLVRDAAVILTEHLHCIWTLPEGIQII